MVEFLLSDSVSARLFIIFGSLVLLSVGASAAWQWGKARRAELELTLKSELVERGWSPGEIKRLLLSDKAPGTIPPLPEAAGPARPATTGNCPAAPPRAASRAPAVLSAVFKGIALLTGVSILGSLVHHVAILSSMNRPTSPPQPPEITLTPERPFLPLASGRSGSCRLYLHGSPMFNVQLTAVITHASRGGELRVEVSPATLARADEQKVCTVKLHAVAGVGDFTVRVIASDPYRKLAEASFSVCVRPAAPVSAQRVRAARLAAQVVASAAGGACRAAPWPGVALAVAALDRHPWAPVSSVPSGPRR